MGMRTLPRKFDAVHRNTTSSRRVIPRVRRAMPKTFGLGASAVVAMVADLELHASDGGDGLDGSRGLPRRPGCLRGASHDHQSAD